LRPILMLPAILPGYGDVPTSVDAAARPCRAWSGALTRLRRKGRTFLRENLLRA
jgi:hypothetical protein